MQTPTRKLRVLFVDDDENIRTTWKYCFGGVFEPTIVDSAERAIELLTHPPNGAPFDVLVSDHRLVGMSGAELCTHARRIAPDTARIIVTAYQDREARLSPAAVVLAKPDLNGTLESVIRRLGNGAATEEDVRRRERDADEALEQARNDFKSSTNDLRSWTPASCEKPS